MEIDEQIIEFVRTNPLLYNQQKKGLKRTKEKNLKWAEIGKKLNISVDKVKKRWRNIKDRHKWKKKESDMLSRSGAAPRKTYKYAALLDFLGDCGSTTNERKAPFYKRFESIDCSEFSQDTEDLTDDSFQRINQPKLEDTLMTESKAEIINLIPSLNENKTTISIERSFCENLHTQLEAANLPTAIFSKFQLSVYTAFNEAVQSNVQS